MAGGTHSGSKDGIGTIAQFGAIRSLAEDSQTGALLAADQGKHNIRRIVLGAQRPNDSSSWKGTVTTISCVSHDKPEPIRAPGCIVPIEYPSGLITMAVVERSSGRIRELFKPSQVRASVQAKVMHDAMSMDNEVSCGGRCFLAPRHVRENRINVGSVVF